MKSSYEERDIQSGSEAASKEINSWVLSFEDRSLITSLDQSMITAIIMRLLLTISFDFLSLLIYKMNLDMLFILFVIFDVPF